jgi:tRNA modification GTPase
VLLVLDGSKSLHAADRELIERSNPENTILVINKTDLPQKLKPGRIKMAKARISAKNETGLDALKNKIATVALNDRPECDSALVTNTRHVHALEKVLASINAFTEGTDKNDPPEFLSVELREALDAIGEILGITTPEEILNHIFENFCIGK